MMMVGSAITVMVIFLWDRSSFIAFEAGKPREALGNFNGMKAFTDPFRRRKDRKKVT